MNNQEFSFPVIEITQPIGTFFIGSIKAEDLVKISHSDVRRIDERDVEKYLGIQRPLEKSRIKQIRTYLKSPDASFPTGVVLSVDERCTVFENGTLILKPYEGEDQEESIPINKIAKILDGQHRIAAFVKDNWQFDFEFYDNINPKFEFNVIIFIGLDIDEQANIFATINLAQNKVNRSIAYDLEGLSKYPSPFRSCHKIAVALDSADEKSPLYHRIKRLGVKTKGRTTSEPLTQAAFVESLIKFISPNPFEDRNLYLNGKQPRHATEKELLSYPFRNMFIDGYDQQIALIIFNYFSAVQNKWTIAWDGTTVEGNILPRSNAFKALMRYLKKIYIELATSGFYYVPSITEFENAFSNISASNEDFTSGNFSPGGSGESNFYRFLLREISIQDLKIH